MTLDPAPASRSPAVEGSAAPPPAASIDPESHAPTPFAITSVAWAPSCGRSYHLIATGGRDGRVRIWRVKPAADDENDEHTRDGEDAKWTASIVADFDQHKYVSALLDIS